MIDNQQRNGNFTSSEIVALTTLAKDKISFGAPALTYIKECNMERRLGRCLTSELSAKPTSWGNLLERRVFELLSTEYTPYFNVTFKHPLFDFWVGSPDATKEDTIIDVKSPSSLKSFCQLVDPMYNGLSGIEAMNAIRENHKDGDKFFYQLVSNGIIMNKQYAELIVYCPYKSELDAIRDDASNFDGDSNKVAWVHFAQDSDLPYLIDGGYYKNLNVIRFEIPQSDKYFLTERVFKASELLIKQMKVYIDSIEPVEII